ncbi:TPA: hypothetical protein ENS27_00185 [bacterium]|nr:hypothetical protein [bacterium]
MKKILALIIFMTLVMGSVAFGASTRWNAMGGEHRFIIDTSNYSLYPGRITMFGNALFVIPVAKTDVKEFYDARYFADNGFVAGALWNVKNMTMALHYNLDTAGTANLRRALAGLAPDPEAISNAQYDMARKDVGSPEWLSAKAILQSQSQKGRLNSLDVREFPDFFWAMKSGKMSIGARVALAMDSASDSATPVSTPMLDEGGVVISELIKPSEEIATSAMSLDFLVGATMYETPAGDLDLGLGIGLQSFSDDDPNSGLKIESEGGMDIAFNARLSNKMGIYTIVPVLSFGTGSNPSAVYDEKSAPNVNAVSYMKGDLGVGVRKVIKEKGLALVGILGGYNATTSAPTITIVNTSEDGKVTKTKKEVLETTDTTLSTTLVAGCEFPVCKWLIVRGGANLKFYTFNDEIASQEKVMNYLPGKANEITDVVVSKKSNNMDFNYNMGLRTIYNGAIIDFLLARNVLHRGPYILSGASGVWATHICVTYAF